MQTVDNLQKLRQKLTKEQIAYCEDIVAGLKNRTVLMNKHGVGAVPSYENNYDVQAYIAHAKQYSKKTISQKKAEFFDKFKDLAEEVLLDVLQNGSYTDKVNVLKLVLSQEVSKASSLGKAQGEKQSGVESKSFVLSFDPKKLKDND